MYKLVNSLGENFQNLDLSHHEIWKMIGHDSFSQAGLDVKEFSDYWYKVTRYVQDYHRYREPRIEWDSKLYNVNLEFGLLVGESDDEQVEPPENLHVEDPSIIDLVSTDDSVIDPVSTSSSDSSSYCITKYSVNGSDNNNGSDNGNNLDNSKGLTVNSCDFSSDDDETLITQPDDVALNGSNGLCKILTKVTNQMNQKTVMTTECLH